jgi:hypothetical protein
MTLEVRVLAAEFAFVMGMSFRYLSFFSGRIPLSRRQVGIEGFMEAVMQEVAAFKIGVTIVEPGGARTEFRFGSAKLGAEDGLL